MPPHAHEHRPATAAARVDRPRFWKDQYRAPAALISSCDRFLLPTFVKMDFGDVIAAEDAPEAGYAFDPESWFAPHFEFRFRWWAR